MTTVIRPTTTIYRAEHGSVRVTRYPFSPFWSVSVLESGARDAVEKLVYCSDPLATQMWAMLQSPKWEANTIY